MSADASYARSRALVATVVASVVAAVVGVGLGWVWMTLADPPRAFWLESDFEAEVAVTVWFWVVGFMACLVAGLVVGLRGEALGVWSLLPLLVVCLVAAVVCAWTGHHWFAPPRTTAGQWAVDARMVGARAGDQSWTTYLPWLLGGLVGYVSAVWTWSRGRG